MKRIQRSLPVVGMHCAACALKVEQAVSAQVGVQRAAVLYNERMLHLDFDEEQISLATIAEVVKGIGFELITADTEYELNERRLKARQREVRRMQIDTIGAWVATIVMMLVMWLPLPHWIHYTGMWLSAISVFFLFTARFHRAALKQLLHRVFSMDTLVSFSTTVSFIAGAVALIRGGTYAAEAHIYFDATVMIPAFVLLGKWMEQRATLRTGDAVAALLNSRPKWALVLRDGVAVELPVEMISVGDKVRVRAGDTIPVDGVVLKGTTTIDEQMISGEPIPVEKEVGSKVYAGTINGTSPITMQALEVGSETVLGTIIETIRKAETDKPPIRRMADRIAGGFVPVVFLLSLLTWGIWMLFVPVGNEDVTYLALRCAISVLVISCPCALGLATPTALTVLIGEAARRHILIRDAAAMELLPQITTVFLDKTGTITTGQPKVVAEEWYASEANNATNRGLLYALEHESTHPLAAAICAHLYDTEREEVLTERTETILGKGIESEYLGQKVLIGNAAFVGVDEPIGAGSHVFFSVGGRVLLHLTIADQVTPESREAVAEMQRMGLEVVLLTGDYEETAREAAESIGVSRYYARLLPHEKSAIVRQEVERGAKVAMIGDGINDSEALSYASVSASFASGSAIAVSVAHLTFIKSDLRLFPMAIRMMQRTKRTIRANFFWALLYNALAIPLAAGVLYPSLGLLVSPAISGAAMAFSSLSVVSNSLLLKKRLSALIR